MNITIHRDGQNYGPYTMEQVKGHLTDGSLLETDFAWYDGCTEWTPLGDVVTKLASPSLTSPPSPPTNPPLSNKAPTYRSLDKPTFAKNKGIVGVLLTIGLLVILCALGKAIFFPNIVESQDSSPSDQATPTHQTVSSSELTIQNPDTDTEVDLILERLFNLAKGNTSANTVEVLVHLQGHDEYGNVRVVDVPVHLDDLTNVRKYASVDYYKQQDVDDHKTIMAQVIEALQNYGVLKSEVNVATAPDIYTEVDSIMQHIFDLAKSNQTFKKMKLLVHLKGQDENGKPIQLDITETVDDLDKVRSFPDVKAYQADISRFNIWGDITGAMTNKGTSSN